MATPLLSDKLASDAVAAVAHYGSVSAAAIALGIPRTTLSSRYLRGQQMDRQASAVEVPMSEDQSKYQEGWTAQDCINELRRVASLDEDKVISRNYFRVNAICAESNWNAHFGTFEEFKRQAGLKLSRQQHQLERHIAKHASVDHYRAMNVERTAYAERYLRTTGRRVQVILRASRSTTLRLSAASITSAPETRRAARPMPDAEKYLARQAERENPDFEYLNFGADLTPEELNGIVDDLLREIDQHAGRHDTAGDAA